MMAQVQCDCGESVLNLIVDTKEITILHCTTWDTYTYSFLCPIHKSRVALSFNTEHLNTLLSNGAKFAEWEWPRIENIDAPRLTEYDVVNMLIELQGVK